MFLRPPVAGLQNHLRDGQSGGCSVVITVGLTSNSLPTLFCCRTPFKSGSPHSLE